jgi:hypothetical protein
MQLFLHIANGIRIVNGTAEWSGALADFLTLEPTYPGLGSASVRYHTPEYSYLETAGVITTPDPLDCSDYISKAGTYAAITYGGQAILAKWKDADTITLTKGQATGPDGVLLTLSADLDIKLSLNRAYGVSEAANTKYRIVAGINAAGSFEAVFVTVETAAAYEHASAALLKHPYLLRECVRNDASSNLLKFWNDGKTVIYDVDITGTANDVTKVLDASVATSFVDVDCLGFIPSGAMVILGFMPVSGGYSGYFREKGSGNTTGMLLAAIASALNLIEFPTNAAGLLQARNSGGSGTTRAAVAGYRI